MNKLNTIFIGSGNFGIPALKELFKLEFINVVAVITQPSRPSGRKQELTPTPVKKFILDSKIKIDLLEPEKLKDESDSILEKYKPELIIVASYGQMIPDNIINYPKYKCFNLHGSLLPILRGAVPVPISILQGLEETGVTMQVMVKELDAGPILSIRRYKIKPDETAASLMNVLAEKAAAIVKEDINCFIRNEITYVDQEHNLASYCYKADLTREKAEIKFETDVALAERMVRAFNPDPVAWVKLENGKELKIFSAELYSKESNEFLSIEQKGKDLILNLKNGSLKLLELQLEGKKRDSFKNYYFLTKAN